MRASGSISAGCMKRRKAPSNRPGVRTKESTAICRTIMEGRAMKKRTISKAAGTKGKGKLKKGYRYAKGGRIVKAKKAK